jgi:cytidylate kinase
MVITIAREAGSGGRSIARLLARRLQYRLIDREIITALARETGMPYRTAQQKDETVESWFERLTVPFDYGPVDLAAPARAAEPAAASAIEVTQRLIRGYADQGNVVILGRAGAALLDNRSDALNVFFYAPVEWRIHQVARHEKVSLAAARERVERTDRQRAEYVRAYYNCDWRDPLLYHLCINTEIIGVEGAVNLLEWTLGSCAKEQRRAA